MDKVIIKFKCPTKKINHKCWRNNECDKCDYIEALMLTAKENAIMLGLFDRKYDNLTCKELRELFVVELEKD